MSKPLISCVHCGTVLDLDRVAASPYKSCPVCKAPLSEEAVTAKHVDATDPNNPEASRKPIRDAMREQLAASLEPIGTLTAYKSKG